MHDSASLAIRIDALLPQTQCGQCGYGGCMPYAEAIASEGAPINRCPPGGEAGIAALAALLNRPALPLDPACGEHRPRQLASIREAECIGCTRCIQACPVDAIAGLPKRMHSVLAEDCTGCGLCLPPCPVDCIDLRPHVRPWLDPQEAEAARRHYRQRQARLQRLQAREPADARTAAALLAAALARRGAGR